MTYDPNKLKAMQIADGLPHDILAPLVPLDGTSGTNFAYDRHHNVPSVLFGLGFVVGLPGGNISGSDAIVYLTPLGQCIVDRMKDRPTPG